MGATEQIEELGRQARTASRALAAMPAAAKNAALLAMAEAVESGRETLLAENAKDLEAARSLNLTAALQKRLLLDDSRVQGMADGLREVADLPDPVGEVVDGWKRPNGLEIRRVRVPLGVIGIIYESRPNVTADAAGLCLKSGNAVVLRGGKEAIRSNTAIAELLQAAAESQGAPAGAIQLVRDTTRDSALALMQADKYLDCLIPRGGEGLIKALQENARVPFIIDGAGVCHTFVDESADLDQAVAIAVNAKTSYPAVCNAMETLLVHQAIADRFLPAVAAPLRQAGVELRGCERTRGLLPDAVPATDQDWDTEYLDLILSIRVVDGLDQAIEHIAQHGSLHSEAIVTRSLDNSRRFTHEVDAAAVYVNASTRFTDGGRFGFGAEIGISTQKLHARGPLGLPELTCVKYVIDGEGHVV